MREHDSQDVSESSVCICLCTRALRPRVSVVCASKDEGGSPKRKGGKEGIEERDSVRGIHNSCKYISLSLEFVDKSKDCTVEC